MCSSTRGPAIAPSLVTWPIMKSAVPARLAWRVSCAAHSRTCATEQDHLGGHQAAAERAVELGHAGRHPLQLARVDILQRDGARRGAGVAVARALLHHGFAQRACGAARRTGAEPLQRGGAAFGAD